MILKVISFILVLILVYSHNLNDQDLAPHSAALDSGKKKLSKKFSSKECRSCVGLMDIRESEEL